MEMNKKQWPISTVNGWKGNINTNPDYQRPAVWSTAQKQLLMDTILRGYDIPKLYLRQISKQPQRFEVVDGQQRLRAIWSFMSGDFRVDKDADDIEGQVIANCHYDELPLEIRSLFDVYPLDVILMSDSDEDEVREMFLRLQNGTTLKAQEKRNAMPGEMRKFVKELTQHDIFTKSVQFSNNRFIHDHVAAQITLIEINGGPVNIKDKDLTKMYEDYAVFSSSDLKARKIKKVLDYLYKMFPCKTPELERYSFVSLYILISNLLEKYVITNREKELFNWFIEFEQYRRDQEVLPEDQCDPEIIAYHEKISHSTDAFDSLNARNEYLTKILFEKIPNIEQKDNQRLFTHEQRMAIYRRDNGFCQLRIHCNGQKCDWDNWQADHIIAWSNGGRTTVENGQVACPACNESKGND
jgi:hypothetical protein